MDPEVYGLRRGCMCAAALIVDIIYLSPTWLDPGHITLAISAQMGCREYNTFLREIPNRGFIHRYLA